MNLDEIEDLLTLRRRAIPATLSGIALLLLSWFAFSANGQPAISSKPVVTSLSNWGPLADGGGRIQIAQDAGRPLDAKNPESLRLTISKSVGRAGIVSSAAGGLRFRSDAWYDLTFYACTETNKHFALTVSLESQDGRTVCARATIPEVGGSWAKYTLALNTHLPTAKGRIVITIPESGTIWLNAITLREREAKLNLGDSI